MTSPSSAPAPFVTVLMSCYNASQWLRESIESILNQTYRDFEFIVVDDGSMDTTLEIIQSYADIDARILVIAKPNTGLADSLNVGIAKARGVWIARMDADDVSEPMRLDKQVQHAIANPDLVFIGTGLTEIDETGRKFATHSYPSSHSRLVSHLMSGQKFPPHSSAFYRTSVVSSIGAYRPRIRRAQDWDLWLRLSEKSRLACLEAPLVHIRKHSNQISHDEAGTRQQIDSRVAMVSYFLRKLNFPDPVDSDEATFDAFWAWMAEQLRADGLFMVNEFRAHAKNAMKRQEFILFRLLTIARITLSRPSLLPRLLRDRLFGESSAARLARKWVRKQKSYTSS